MSKTLKSLIVGITGLLSVGCVFTPTMKNKSFPAWFRTGTYEYKVGKDTAKIFFLDNGVVELYEKGKPNAVGQFSLVTSSKWKIVDGDIHAGLIDKGDAVISVNRDGRWKAKRHTKR